MAIQHYLFVDIFSAVFLDNFLTDFENFAKTILKLDPVLKLKCRKYGKKIKHLKFFFVNNGNFAEGNKREFVGKEN